MIRIAIALCAAGCMVSSADAAPHHRPHGAYVFLFDNAAPRPPRSIPAHRARTSFGNANADDMPVPRPRPGATQPEPSAPAARPAVPPIHPSAVAFPPVAPLD
ncbi:MAG TPA: hypothetical protein VHA77_02600 [Xanthobacteraceae bacterium]|jgi:hypothetical protein|nr:hypothetical protein [Xanthobacteraceae bacterium]